MTSLHFIIAIRRGGGYVYATKGNRYTRTLDNCTTHQSIYAHILRSMHIDLIIF
jgi:hypothetical protein